MSVFEFESREKFIAEVFPEGKPTSLGSLDLYESNRQDWLLSRSRLLETGLRSLDQELVITILNEYAYAFDIDLAVRKFIQVWGRMVEAQLDEAIARE